ncbi:MAG: hypothetical protein FWC03_07065 [Treponema sp.]|nr:hypothetical protein [Treponema sp.]
MINFKWGLISGAAALVISVVTGIVSDVMPVHIFLRALLFTAVFFGIGIGINILINNFFPELLLKDEEPPAAEEQPGSRVNITLGSTGEYAVPEMYKSSGGTQDLGNIEELISGSFKPRRGASEGIDRKREDDYNGSGGSFNQNDNDFMGPSPSPVKPAFVPMFGDNSDGLGGLADLDSMSTAFSSGGDYSGRASGGGSVSGDDSAFSSDSESLQMQTFDDVGAASAKGKSKNDKPQALQGDFSPQEIAQGIRTVLDKDK